MKRYKLELTGLSPIIMHRDNLAFGEVLEAWRKHPENAGLGKAGDDRSPPWTWVGSLYHDGHVVGIDQDNMMTCLREGGAKVIRKGKSTYKKESQSGILIDQPQLEFAVDGRVVSYDAIAPLVGDLDFAKHLEAAQDMGFELLVKRARIGRAKHVRVRPMFRNWTAACTLTVIDEQLSGITETVLDLILRQCGALVGLCDWRPGGATPGQFGKFESRIEAI